MSLCVSLVGLLSAAGVGKSTLIANIFARPLSDAQVAAAGPDHGRVIPPKTVRGSGTDNTFAK